MDQEHREDGDEDRMEVLAVPGDDGTYINRGIVSRCNVRTYPTLTKTYP